MEANTLTVTPVKPDVVVTNLGTIFTFELRTSAARDWVTEHIPHAMYFGGALCVEHRFAWDIAQGMQGDGLVLR